MKHLITFTVAAAMLAGSQLALAHIFVTTVGQETPIPIAEKDAVLPDVACNALPGSEDKVAVVVGNDTYEHVRRLVNPVNDARAVAAKLCNLGFQVFRYENLHQKQSAKMLQEFSAHLKPGGVALFYYSGQGLQINGADYMPTVNADPGSLNETIRQSLSINDVLNAMLAAKAATRLFFFDACRNNPFGATQTAPVTPNVRPDNTLLSFATQPGGIAWDASVHDGSSAHHGLYTEYLLKALEQTGQPVELALKQLQHDIHGTSENMVAQIPWTESSLSSEFCFGGCKPGAK